MGKPKKENLMSSTEQSRKRCSDPEKRLADNKKKRDSRKAKAVSTDPVNLEELKAKGEADRIRKAESRSKQSRQKQVGTRIQDRNCKRHKVSKDSEQCSSSTSHVQKHHNILKVKLSLKGKKKFNHVTKTLTNSITTFTA